MRKLFFLLFLLMTVSQAQTENTHVVYFETDQFNVPEIETNRLVLFIQSLKDIEIERIAIYGFCDDRGSDSYNLTLSQNRADAIKKIFSGFGVDDNLISNVDGKGARALVVLSCLRFLGLLRLLGPCAYFLMSRLVVRCRTLDRAVSNQFALSTAFLGLRLPADRTGCPLLNADSDMA